VRLIYRCPHAFVILRGTQDDKSAARLGRG
jgi:hypothetical protein